MHESGIRDLKARVGRERCISKGGPDCIVEVHNLEESKEEVTMLVDVRSPEELGTQQEEQLLD